MNTHFVASVDGFVTVGNKMNKAFGSLMEFAYSVVKEAVGDAESIKGVLKNAVDGEEKAYRAAHPKHKEWPTAYRTAKSAIISAVGAGVSLVDAKGNLRGKSELEKLTKEAKGDKMPVDKFAGAMKTAGDIFAKVEGLEDVRKCKALLAMLADTVCKAEAALVGVTHREKAPLSAEDKAFIAAELQAKAASAGVSATH